MTEKITYSLDIQDTRLADGITQFFSGLPDFEDITEQSLTPDIVFTDKQGVKTDAFVISPSDLPVDFRSLVGGIVREISARSEKFAGLTFNKRYKTLINAQGETVNLTGLEAALLDYLYQNADAECTKDSLLKSVWDYGDNVTTHTVETHIYRLRQKFPPLAPLINTTENGYMLLLSQEGDA